MGWGDAIGAIVVLILGVLIYFIPSIVGKDKRNAGAIFVLNLLLGWTIIGWVGALIWAMTAEPPAGSEVPATQPSAERAYRCPRCQQPVTRDATGCPSCGIAYVRTAAPAAIIPDKKCPDCAERVKADARKCRFCGFLFTA